MPKIVCPSTECIYNGNHYVCNAKKVELKYRNMATVNEGRVDMWVCKQYELAEDAKRINKEFAKFFEYNTESEGSNADSDWTSKRCL